MKLITDHERKLLESFADFVGESIGMPRGTVHASMQYLVDRFINDIEKQQGGSRDEQLRRVRQA